jgi:hypothetical protein
MRQVHQPADSEGVDADQKASCLLCSTPFDAQAFEKTCHLVYSVKALTGEMTLITQILTCDLDRMNIGRPLKPRNFDFLKTQSLIVGCPSRSVKFGIKNLIFPGKLLDPREHHLNCTPGRANVLENGEISRLTLGATGGKLRRASGKWRDRRTRLRSMNRKTPSVELAYFACFC